jgi:hypothetical protein
MPDLAGTIPVPNAAGDISNWLNVFGQAFGLTGNSSSDSVSPEGLGAGMSVLPLILQMITAQDYSPDAAEKDSGPAVMLLLKQAMEQGMPGIANAENQAGGYDSTTAGLLRNDLSSRAAGEGAALIAKNKATYGALRNGQANSLIALINAITNASRRTTTSSTTPNLASSRAARAAALGALAAGALGKKPPTKPKPPGLGSRRQNPYGEPLQPLEEAPQPLMNLMYPDPVESIDDMAQLGPTPEVSVNNTANLDATGQDNFSNDLAPDFGGLDLMDLGSLSFSGPDTGSGDESDGLDFSFGGGTDTTDETDSDWDFLGDSGYGGDLGPIDDGGEGKEYD